MPLRTATFLLAIAALTTGCRTYGGHGSEDATYTQILSAVERYEAQAERMRGDYQALIEASGQNPELLPFSSRLASTLEIQEASLRHAQALADNVSASSDYRALNRALGSLVSHQQRVDDAYTRILEDIQGDRVDLLRRQDPARYQIVPAYYARIEASLARVPLREAIAGN